jgi:integrase
MRRAKGPRLWLKPGERNARGGIEKHASWCIKDDGGVRQLTGCPEADRAGAEKALAAYIAAKYAPSKRKNQTAAEVLVTDVLALWGSKVVPGLATAEKTGQRLIQLGEWWEGRTLDDVNGQTVGEYVEWRTAQAWKSAKPKVTGVKARKVTPQGARRELEDMRAAINWHRGQGLTREVVEVPLPKRGKAREVHYERHEAARLLWQTYRARETMTLWRPHQVGKQVETAKRPQRHIARFILVGLYTGTRAGAICTASFVPMEGRSWIDLESGTFHRLAIGKEATNKRQPPVKLPDRLLAHIRRWSKDKRKDGSQVEYVVEFRGKPVEQVNKGFGVALEAAGLKGSPHALRHTCATWLMQRGAKAWDAAHYLGMSEAMLWRVYGHWSPDFQAGIAGGKKRDRPAPELHDIFSVHYNRDADLRVARKHRDSRLAVHGIPHRRLAA